MLVDNWLMSGLACARRRTAHVGLAGQVDGALYANLHRLLQAKLSPLSEPGLHRISANAWPPAASRRIVP